MYKQGFLLLVITLMFCACKSSKQLSSQLSVNKTYLFPTEWIGHYKGDLYILGADNDTMKVEMELIIDSPDGIGMYPWVLKYGGDKDIRFYGLEVVDAEKGHYLIDEYNSIKLDAFLRSNHLITKFNVVDNDLIFHYEKQATGIAIEVYASPNKSINTTGGEIIAQDTVPQVSSYSISSFQSGFLTQIK